MSKLGDELVRSMAQALAHAQGKRTGARVHRVARFSHRDLLKALRKSKPKTALVDLDRPRGKEAL